MEKGFVTATRVPDIFEDKTLMSRTHNTYFNKDTGQVMPVANEYTPPKPHKFRDEFELEPGMKDF